MLMSGLRWKGAKMDACTSGHTCKMYLISFYRAINDISEIVIASDVNF